MLPSTDEYLERVQAQVQIWKVVCILCFCGLATTILAIYEVWQQ